MPYRVRGRGHFTAPTTRSGKSFVYAGRRVTIAGENFQLNWQGPEVVQAITEGVVEAFENLSEDALAYMQSIVPVDTGELQESCYVNISTDGGRLVLRIGASAAHAIFVELGTYKMGAQPYIRPTYDYVLKLIPILVMGEVQRRGRIAG